ncbi:MAG: glycerophosphodiester phosphodiesterase [Betaproteobacteria bacterium]|nr:glycerophosphodiester phosphodiesterase [Betaproteobacteria bacterium]
MTTSPQPKWPFPTLFAHRGGGRHAPENTLAAMKEGRAQGFLAVEFDVKLSRDTVAFLLHDDTLDRTTDGSGAARERTIAELEHLHANRGHEAAFPGEPVPRFTTVAKYLHGLGLLANVEIKPCPGREAETGRLVAELAMELWRDRFVKPLLSSFSADALAAARAVSSDLPLGVLCDAPEAAHWELARALGAVSLHCNHRQVDADLVRTCHARGLRLLVWTVNDLSRASELLRLGVDGLFTDELAAMAKAFPAQLGDAGKPMSDPVEDMVADWTAIPPPMPPAE